MKRALVAVCLVAGFARWCSPCDDEPAARIRIATFNIEDFPRHEAQIDGAFDEISRLDASIVALQEITAPALFSSEAHRRLGTRWRSIFANTRPDAASPAHHLGVLFDTERWQYKSMQLHDDTRIEGRHKPVLEVRLRDRVDDNFVRVLVVHLKAGSDGREIRAEQYRGLARLLARTTASGDRVILLGDFNATHDGYDRRDLAMLASQARLDWATEALACSAFWDRDDGCFRSRLDHVLANGARRVQLAGACATHGCDRQDSCPAYVGRVSDHCPVIVELQ